MQYKILESLGVEIENTDDAAFNSFLVSGESGIIAGVLNECRLIDLFGTIVIDTGELMIQGFRIKITEAYQYTPVGTAASRINYHIIGRLELHTGGEVSFNIITRTISELQQDDLHKLSSGIHEVELAKFTHYGNTISSLSSTVQFLSLGSGGFSENDKKEVIEEAKKLFIEKNQGSANVGKILVVGADGNLTLIDMPEVEGGDVVGYVDENKNIILKGNLAEDKYSVKYEMEDENGNISYIEIGDLVFDNTATYTVTTPTLTNCTFSGAKEAIKGQGYEATVTANDGYKLSTLTATMEGGGSITTDKATGKIGTSKVTGNITITAEAEKKQAAEPTNFFNSNEAPAAAGRLGSDGNNRTDAPNSFATNYIPVQNGDIVKISGCTICGISTGTNTYFMCCYNAEKVKIFAGQPNASGAYCTVVADSTSYEGTVKIINNSVKFVRFTCSRPSDSSKPVDVNNIVINIERNGVDL